MKKFFSVLVVTLLLIALSNKVFSQVNTIPAGGSPYANLNAAFAAINAGGPYTGVAVTVTITANLVEPAGAILNGGTFTSCLIRPNGVRLVGGNFNEAIIVLDGADNVTIDGLNSGGNSLSFNNLNAGTNSGVLRMSNGAQNNAIRNCSCMGLGSGGTTTPIGGRIINVAQSTNGIGNNNNIIEKNVVIGGRRGIQTFGTATPAALPVTNDNTIIRDNTVKNSSSLHIFVGSESRDNTVTGNDIFNDAVVNADVAPRAIGLQCVGLNIITNNRIHNVAYATFEPPTATSGPNGLIGMITIPQILTAPGSNVTTFNIVNNFVAYADNNDPVLFIYGIGPLSNPTVVPYTSNIFNNSVHIGGVSGAALAVLSACLEVAVTTVGSTLNIANNIAMNSRTGGTTASNHIGDDESSMPVTGVTFNTDYNFSKAADTTGRGFDGGYAGRIFRGDVGLELMKDTACIQGNGQHNMYKPARFVSPVDLHLAGPIGGDMCGRPIATVTTDIDGAPRNSTYPYRGADEGATLKTFTLGGNLEGAVGTSQITVILRTVACGIVSTCTADLAAGAPGTVVFCFGDSVGAGPYYIDVQNLNHLETYSAAAIPFGAATIYDFKPARATAFGSNLTVAGPPHAFYGGDVNKDNIINLADLLIVSNAVTSFATGCRLRADVTYNGAANLADILVTFNNVTGFVTAIKPCPEPLINPNVYDNLNIESENLNAQTRETINHMIY